MTKDTTPEAQQPNPQHVATCDQEVWVKQRILTAMRMAIALDANLQVGADTDLAESGIEGVANGCAVEVIRTLGMRPEYTNLRRPHRIDDPGVGIGIPR